MAIRKRRLSVQILTWYFSSSKSGFLNSCKIYFSVCVIVFLRLRLPALQLICCLSLVRRSQSAFPSQLESVNKYGKQMWATNTENKYRNQIQETDTDNKCGQQLYPRQQITLVSHDTSHISVNKSEVKAGQSKLWDCYFTVWRPASFNSKKDHIQIYPLVWGERVNNYWLMIVRGLLL